MSCSRWRARSPAGTWPDGRPVLGPQRPRRGTVPPFARSPPRLPAPRPPRRAPFHHPKAFTLGRSGAEPERFELPPLGVGYSHELIEVNDCLRAGRTESEVMPLADTLAVQRVLNEACEQLGVHHREDERVAV